MVFISAIWGHYNQFIFLISMKSITEGYNKNISISQSILEGTFVSKMEESFEI